MLTCSERRISRIDAVCSHVAEQAPGSGAAAFRRANDSGGGGSSESTTTTSADAGTNGSSGGSSSVADPMPWGGPQESGNGATSNDGSSAARAGTGTGSRPFRDAAAAAAGALPPQDAAAAAKQQPRGPGRHVEWTGAVEANAIAQGRISDSPAGPPPDSPYGKLYASLQLEQEARQVSSQPAGV